MLSASKRLTWKACAWLLYGAGALRFVDREASGHRFVLAYHRVIPRADEDRSFVQPGMYVTGESFRMQMRYLQARYRVVPLDELVSLKGGNACAITFDDGWRDTYTTAFPILREHGLPATVFVATNLVGSGRWPWPDRICFYIHRASPIAFSAAFEAAWRDHVGTPSGVRIAPGDRFDTAEMVLRRLKRLELDVLTRVMSRVDECFQTFNAVLHQEPPWLTWNEAREMAEHGMSFGSHTANHVILTSVPLPDARREITDSRSELASRLGRPVVAFCYPNGAYNADIIRVVAEAGYQYAVTTDGGSLERSAGPLRLNRMMIHDDVSSSHALFACALAGVYGFRYFLPSNRRRGTTSSPW